MFFSAQAVFAENHEEKNIVDQAKEINEQIKKKQAATEANIASEIGIDGEEPLPLNDPFAGNEGTTGSLGGDVPEEEQQDEMSLYNFKLAGLISGKDNSYISLVNAGGEVITVTIGQYLGKIK